MLARRMRSPRPFASVKKTQQLVGGSDGTEFFCFSFLAGSRIGGKVRDALLSNAKSCPDERV